jgi:hypothetical protein
LDNRSLNDSIERQFISGSEAVVFGCIGILYGVSLRRLRNAVGSAAQWGGTFEIPADLLFITIVLSFIGFIVQVPAELCEIIVLYKSAHIMKAKEEENSPAAQDATSN